MGKRVVAPFGRTGMRAALAVAALLAAVPAWAQQATPADPAQPGRRPEEAQRDPFRAFDIDKDGVLNIAELKSAAAARFDELNPDADDSLDPREATPVLPGNLFQQADTNGDGVVNKAEYLAFLEQLCRTVDTDRDDTLDRAELGSEQGRLILRMVGR